MSRDAGLAVKTVRGWYEKDAALFRFLGGRLLAAAFTNFSQEFSRELANLVTDGEEKDVDFVIAIMENYHGEKATHRVLKRIVTRYPEDESKLDGVAISFDSTGVVSGEFGFAEALREKKIAMIGWLKDSRPEVRAFAEGHIRGLDLSIADHQRRGEERSIMRKLRFENDTVAE